MSVRAQAYTVGRMLLLSGATAQWSRRHDCSGLEGKGDLCVEHAQCAVLFGHLGEVTNQLVIQAAPLRGLLCL